MRPKYTTHEGFSIPAGFPLKALPSALEYRAAPGDIFVSAYPKCGTTWAQNIVYLILHDGASLSADQKLTELFPHLEEVGKDTVGALPTPRCIKTHLPFAMTPYHREARYIYVARNPFDCALSFYHHTRGFPKHYDFADGTFDEFFECFVTGRVDFGDYFDNLTSWYAHKDDANVLFLTYEAMKADPRSAILSAGRFLGSDSVENDDVMEDILLHSSFESMSQAQDRWSSRRPADMPTFIRKGIVGGWMSQFSPAQTKRLLERFSIRTAGTDLESLWPDLLNAARQHGPGA